VSFIGEEETMSDTIHYKQLNINHIAWIRKLWSEKKGLVALLFVLTLISSAVAVLLPYISKLLLDTIQRLLEHPGTTDPMLEIDRLLMLLIAVGFGGFIASFFPAIRGMTNSVFEHLLRMKFFKKILEKNYKFFSEFATGDIVTRLTSDLYDFPKLSWFLCSGIFRAVESISKVLFCLIAMMLISPKLTLFSLIPLPLMLAVFWVTSDKVYDVYRKNEKAVSEVNEQLEMSFSGVRIIKAYACEDKYRRFFNEVLQKRWKTEMTAAKLDVILHLIYQYIDLVAQVGIVFAGGLMAVRGKISIGTFYAFYTYLMMLIYPILDIPQLFVYGKKAFVNIDRLEEMASFPVPGKSASEKDPVPGIHVQGGVSVPGIHVQGGVSVPGIQVQGNVPLEGSVPVPGIHVQGGVSVPGIAPQEKTIAIDIATIDFNEVSFTYPGRVEKALDGVSFRVTKGERLGVIGPVGSGKSTLIKVLLGLLPPDSGMVKINGVPLDAIDTETYAKKIGYVPQEALLFSGTLKENIDFFIDEPNDTVFNQALRISQMSDEVANFTDRELTVVGQRGLSLSGGQKQRMAIARAIARKPELMVFDDITASLDAANEERLMNELNAFAQNLTFIIVSHRLSTLQYVDKILFLDRGKVVGFGTHEELMLLPAYAAFIREHFLEQN